MRYGRLVAHPNQTALANGLIADAGRGLNRPRRIVQNLHAERARNSNRPEQEAARRVAKASDGHSRKATASAPTLILQVIFSKVLTRDHVFFDRINGIFKPLFLILLNRVQRDMRHFQVVFGFEDVINISGDAV